MATITTINSTDWISDSRTDINTNFSNLNSDKIETSVLDTDTALTANSDAKVATQKAVKTYIDTAGGANASESARGLVEEATDAEVTAGTDTGGTGAKLFIPPSKLTTRINALLAPFGGTGVDGALTITTGTTTIDCGNAKVVIKNYTSISITGDGKLGFSNPHANGTIIILKSQGNVTITSSSLSAIDVSSVGAAGGAGGLQTSTAGKTNGNAGGEGTGFLLTVTGGGATFASQSVGGSSSAKPKLTANYSKYFQVAPGSGGASGGFSLSNGNATTGSGGRGGGALIIECGGAYNFTTGAITAAAGNGVNASNGTSTQYAFGGGGGGGGGSILVLYKSLTANSGSYTVTAGTGGNSVGAGIGSGLGNPWSSSGGGSVINTGVSAVQGSDTAWANSSAGGAGTSWVAQNYDY